jgi:hypothetical protein
MMGMGMEMGMGIVMERVKGRRGSRVRMLMSASRSIRARKKDEKFRTETGNIITSALKDDCHSCRARDGMSSVSTPAPRIYDERIFHPQHDRRPTSTKIASRSNNGR